MVGRKTEKTRFKRSVNKIQEVLRTIRHWSIKDQVEKINQILRGHYNYYGMAGNLWSITKIYKITERYWRRMLSSRSQKSYITWEKFNKIKSIFPLERPKLSIPFSKLKMYAKL